MVEMEPLVALMRRYCIDYTTVHDITVCDDIMRDDYTVTVSGRTLHMPDYRKAVEGAFRWFPTLSLTVHELVMSEDRLAMRFSEHGASAKHDGSVAVWRGISLYRWDGRVLTACDVEQDFAGRERQLVAGRSDPLDDPHPDPWGTTRPVPPSPDAEAIVRHWLDAWACHDDRSRWEGPSFRLVVDDSDLVGPDNLSIADASIEISDCFSAGGSVAARAIVHGRYDGGLPGVDDRVRGRPCELPITAFAHVQEGVMADVRIIRDRWGLARRLQKPIPTKR